MSDTIELPRALADRIRAAAAAEGQDLNNYAVATLEQVFGGDGSNEEEEPSEDLIASLKEGLAQVNAGELRTFTDADAAVEAAFAARRARIQAETTAAGQATAA